MKKQNEKGITLIALVITIIIILILTGIAIRFAVGEDEGIITKTNQAVEGQIISQAQEELGSAWGSATLDFMKNRKHFSNDSLEVYLEDKDNINSYLTDKGEIENISYDDSTGIYTVTYEPIEIDTTLTFNITKNGKVSYSM